MTSLSDDLLKSRTIPELRELIGSLDKDAESKRTELQHMVGSKYHDFIQSADKIATMKQQCNTIEKQITEFSNNNKELIVNAKSLLSKTTAQNSSHKLSPHYAKIEDLNCTTLWEKISDQDLFGATKMLLVVGLLRSSKRSSYKATNGSLPQLAGPSQLVTQTIWTPSAIAPFFSSASLESISAVAVAATTADPALAAQLSAVSFLAETVADDAKMVLLDYDAPTRNVANTSKGIVSDETSMATAHVIGGYCLVGTGPVVEKAKALAALSLVSFPNGDEYRSIAIPNTSTVTGADNCDNIGAVNTRKGPNMTTSLWNATLNADINANIAASSASTANTAVNEASPQHLLRVYLSAADIKIEELLNSDLLGGDNIDICSSNASGADDVVNATSEKERDSGGIEQNGDHNCGNGTTNNPPNKSTTRRAADNLLTRLHEELSALVQLLQHIVIDTNLLFLANPTTVLSPDPNSLVSGVRKGAGLSPPPPPKCAGLVQFFQKLLFSETVSQLQRYITASDIAGASSVVNGHASSRSLELEFDMLAAINSTTAATTTTCATATNSASLTVNSLIREQRRTFHLWLTDTLKRVTERCKALLSSLRSASEVAVLQQQVWHMCVYVTELAGDTTMIGMPPTCSTLLATSASVRDDSMGKGDEAPTARENAYGYTQAQWKAASTALLAPAKSVHTSVTATSTCAVNPVTYLWSTVFRECFLFQVERLLQKSCDAVLRRSKAQVFNALRVQGIVVDPVTCAVTVITADQQSNGREEHTKGECDDTCGSICNFAADTSYLSSPKIYQLAEKLRSQFEGNIEQLLAGVTSNPSVAARAASQDDGGDDASADPHASRALEKAVRTRCAQLVGHLLLLLRLVAEACQKNLVSRLALGQCGPDRVGNLYQCLNETLPKELVENGCESESTSIKGLLDPQLLALMRRYGGANFAGARHSTALERNLYNSKSGRQGGRNIALNTPLFQSSSQQHHRHHISREEQCLLSGLLFVGRVAWLFKIRGDFLTSALEPPGLSSVRCGIRSGTAGEGRCRSGSESVVPPSRSANYDLTNEDQFRSAFEIADTNGDSILSFTEAVEALQALSVNEAFNFVDGDVPPQPQQHATATSNSNSHKSTNSTVSDSTGGGGLFGLSSQRTPSISYAEFALICGSVLLKPYAFRPVQRFLYMLDNLIALAHITWAIATVQILGSTLREQISYNLGFSGTRQPKSNSPADAPASTAVTSTGVSVVSNATKKLVRDKDKYKPFKLSWIAQDMSLYDSEEDESVTLETKQTEGTSEGTASASISSTNPDNNAVRSKDKGVEKILVPVQCTSALSSFLHKLSQHSAAAMISIDTMQTAPPISPSNGDCGVAASSATTTAATNFAVDSLHSASMDIDAFDNANLSFQPAFDVMAGFNSHNNENKYDNEKLFDTNMSSNSNSTSKVLAFVVNRVLVHLALAYVSYIYNTIHATASSSNSNSNSNSNSSDQNFLIKTEDNVARKTQAFESSGLLPVLLVGEVMEDAALQAIFDLSVCEGLAKSWGVFSSDNDSSNKGDRRVSGILGGHRAAKSNVSDLFELSDCSEAVGELNGGGSYSVEATWKKSVRCWFTHVDLVMGEVLLPLLLESVAKHSSAVSLLLLQCNCLHTTLQHQRSIRVPFGDGIEAYTKDSRSSSVSSEQILSRIFPDSTQLAPRFVLLPLAITTAATTTPSTIVSDGTVSGSTKPQQPHGVADTRKGKPAGVATEGTNNKNSTTGVGGASSSGSNTSGFLKKATWW